MCCQRQQRFALSFLILTKPHKFEFHQNNQFYTAPTSNPASSDVCFDANAFYLSHSFQRIVRKKVESFFVFVCFALFFLVRRFPFYTFLPLALTQTLGKRTNQTEKAKRKSQHINHYGKGKTLKTKARKIDELWSCFTIYVYMECYLPGYPNTSASKWAESARQVKV